MDNIEFFYPDGGDHGNGCDVFGDNPIIKVVTIGDKEEIMGVIGQRESKEGGGAWDKVSFMISRYVKLY